MANIRVDVDYTILDGSEVVFRSPVDCSAITGLKVYYLNSNGVTASQVFTLADAHGNNVGNIDHLFAEDVVVKVILDVTKGMAFVQNADTNAYLEAQLASKRPNTWMPTAEEVGAAPSSHTHTIAQGGTGATDRANAMKNLANLGMNAIASTADDTVANWAAKGSGYSYFNKTVLNNQPTQRGFLVNKVQDSTIHQEWHTVEQHSKVYVRAGQGTAWMGGSVWETSQIDFVTATGTSGVWTYWKFNSGLCIAMGTPTVTWSEYTSLTTGFYRSVASLDLTGIFTSVMGGTSSNAHRYVNCIVQPSASTSAQIWATSPVSGAGNAEWYKAINVVLFGKWK